MIYVKVLFINQCDCENRFPFNFKLEHKLRCWKNLSFLTLSFSNLAVTSYQTTKLKIKIHQIKNNKLCKFT